MACLDVADVLLDGDSWVIDGQVTRKLEQLVLGDVNLLLGRRTLGRQEQER